MTSLALQHGASVDQITARLKGLRFESGGLTDDRELPHGNSVMDYVARRLAADFGLETTDIEDVGARRPAV